MAEKHGVAAVVAESDRLEIEPTLPLSLPIVAGDGSPGSGRIGRPHGSRNKVTAEMVAYLRRKYADPLEGLAATITRTVGDLAEELGCSKLEAFTLQHRAMSDLAPYLYAKVPANMKLQGEGRFVLTIGDEVDPGAGDEGEDGGAFDIEGEIVDIKQ